MKRRKTLLRKSDEKKNTYCILVIAVSIELFGLSLFHSFNFKESTYCCGPPQQNGIQSSLVVVAKYSNIYANVRINIVPTGNVELHFPNGTNVNTTSAYSISLFLPNTVSFLWPQSGGGPLGVPLSFTQPIEGIVLP
ncbi:MAG: hypothetical protein ACREAN_00960, partial [Nitrosopumilaceae archaeon]